MVRPLDTTGVNSLLPNDAIWRHDLCDLSISFWDLYGVFNTRRYTLVQGFSFYKLFLMGCKELMGQIHYPLPTNDGKCHGLS